MARRLATVAGVACAVALVGCSTRTTQRSILAADGACVGTPIAQQLVAYKSSGLALVRATVTGLGDARVVNTAGGDLVMTPLTFEKTVVLFGNGVPGNSVLVNGGATSEFVTADVAPVPAVGQRMLAVIENLGNGPQAITVIPLNASGAKATLSGQCQNVGALPQRTVQAVLLDVSGRMPVMSSAPVVSTSDLLTPALGGDVAAAVSAS